MPKELVSDNKNLLVLFKQNALNLHHICNYQDTSINMKLDAFKDVCAEACKDRYASVVVTKQQPIDAAPVGTVDYSKR